MVRIPAPPPHRRGAASFTYCKLHASELRPQVYLAECALQYTRVSAGHYCICKRLHHLWSDFAKQLTYFIATPPYRGWQRSEGLLLLHSFLSLDIFAKQGYRGGHFVVVATLRSDLFDACGIGCIPTASPVRRKDVEEFGEEKPLGERRMGTHARSNFHAFDNAITVQG